MQAHGYIEIDGQKVKVLVRQKRYSRLLKIRKTGSDGSHFLDEEIFLDEERELFQELLDGCQIEI